MGRFLLDNLSYIIVFVAIVSFIASMVYMGADMSGLQEPLMTMTKGEFMGWTFMLAVLFGRK